MATSAWPLLLHPFAALVGLVLGWVGGGLLATITSRLSYDDEFFEPERGPRLQPYLWLHDLEDESQLHWRYRLPLVGYLIGMLEFCHFFLLLPPSSCFDCGHLLAWEDRIPLVSYLRLGGRCRHCAGAIPRQHFWIEAVTPMLVSLVFALRGLTLEAVVGTFLIGLCTVASVVDWNYQIIPDEVPTSGTAVGLGVATAHTAWALTGGGAAALSQAFAERGAQALWTAPALVAPYHLGWALGGALVGGMLLWSLQRVGSWLTGTQAMGGGDIKLAFALGLFVGPAGAGIGLFYAAMFGAVVGVGLMAIGGGKREAGFTKFAFGPYICLGVLVVLVVGPELAFQAWIGFVHVGITPLLHGLAAWLSGNPAPSAY